jgi:NDP-sugar pyrophosphorylase family protein
MVSTSKSKALPTVCILAGGLGTRLGGLVADTPKPLLEVAGEPFLLHQLRLLAANGGTSVVLCTGYLGEQVEEQVGAERFGIDIRYTSDGPELAGTLGAIRQALPLLPGRFLVLYGDTYLRLDYRAAVDAWDASGLAGLMTVFRNEGRWDRSNVVFGDDRILAYDKSAPTPEMRWIDYGLGGLDSRALDLVDNDERDLSTLQQQLVAAGELCGYEVSNRFYEIGTAAGLAETDSFLRAPRD